MVKLSMTTRNANLNPTVVRDQCYQFADLHRPSLPSSERYWTVADHEVRLPPSVYELRRPKEADTTIGLTSSNAAGAAGACRSEIRPTAPGTV
jgi:hypothetical protein